MQLRSAPRHSGRALLSSNQPRVLYPCTRHVHRSPTFPPQRSIFLPRSGSFNARSGSFIPRSANFVPRASSFQATAQDFANNVNKNVMNFVEEQQLKEKARGAADSAQKSLKDAYAGAQDQARRLYTRIESEYNISEKARKASQRVAEAAQEAEQTYGVKAHVRVWLQNIQRRLPLVQKKLGQFAATQTGKAAMVAAFVVCVYTGVIWNLLHFVLLLWWLLLPLSLVMVGFAQRMQEERFREYQSQGSARSSKPTSRRYTQQSGPIIDAEWSPVDKK